MFGRKQNVTTVKKVLEISDETRQALTSLENDLQVLGGMLREVIGVSRDILATLTAEVISDADVDEEHETGVEPFQRPARRVRGSAFRRRPRSEQVAELLEILSDGQWHNAWDEAERLAGDERERRYLRSSLSTRLREMHEDTDRLERRDCATSRAMYEFRLKR